MRRLVFIGFAAVTLVASLAAWHWRTERIAINARQNEAKVPRPVVAAPRIQPPSAPAAAAPVPVVAPPEAAKPAEPTRAAYFEAMRPEAMEARRMKNPRLTELLGRKLRLELLLKNGAFLRSYNLTGEQRERLLSAWVQRELEVLDLRTIRREVGFQVAASEMRAEQQAVDKRMQEVEAAVLGSEGGAALAEYRRSQQVRDFVGTVVGEATLAGFSLTAEQVDAVTAILVHSRGNRPVTSVGQVDLAVAERQLAPVLTAEQAELLLLPLRARAASAKLTEAVFNVRPPLPRPTSGPR